MQKASNSSFPAVRSFNFVANPQAKVLILGSMPGVASLTENQYYAHPRNHFWPIMEALFGEEAEDKKDKQEKYTKRLQLVKNKHIALWDVLAQCERKGSLDSDIDRNTLLLNDFAMLFTYAPEIKTIFFNGKTAEKLFRQHALRKNNDLYADFKLVGLPSTSPAYAKMPFSEKLSHWEKLKSFHK